MTGNYPDRNYPGLPHKMAASLEAWVSDNLMSILGLSDKRTVEYLIGAARKSSSCDALLTTLKDSGALPRGVEATVEPFVAELWKRVPRKYPAAPTATKIIPEKVNVPSYKLVESESDSEEVSTNKVSIQPARILS